MYNSQTAYQNIMQLKQHAKEQSFILTELFHANPNRNTEYSIECGNLKLDYSKNLINNHTLKNFENALKNCNIKSSINKMLSGENLNTLEQRPALHIALRFEHDLIPKYAVNQAKKSLRDMEEFAKNIPNNITDIIHIGIGGSDLGPRLVYTALQAMYKNKINAHFLNNIDGEQIDKILSRLTAKNTLILVCSKTFTTLETCQNLSSCINWLKKSTANHLDHIVAITSSSQKAQDIGIKYIFPFEDWVGGRFSVWSSVGLVIILCYGITVFKEFLHGAAVIDNNFINQDFKQNLSQMLAMIGIWYRNVFNLPNYCIAAYSQSLNYFTAYLQQLDMESNGKSTGLDNQRLAYHTAPIVFGEVGTHCQHAYFQLLHQGTQWMPVDFISYVNPHHQYIQHHKILLQNCFAQAKALMLGKNDSNPHLMHVGNRPSNMISLKDLSAHSIGSLLAMYEHKIFTQGIFWHINSFDQWGVEFGKKLAQEGLKDIQYENCNI